METELRCPICRDYFTEPVMLQCTHHICAAHLSTLGSQGQLACPVCGDLSEASLRVDRTLQVVVDVHRERVQSLNGGDDVVQTSSAPLCGFCEEKPATRHCIQCAGVLCEECEKTSHSKGFFKSHTVVDLGNQDAKTEKSVWSARMLCDDHAEEKLQFYCLDCRKPVCAHCLILGEHKGHQNTPIDQAAETGKDTLTAWVEKLKQRMIAADELLDRLRSEEQEVQRGAEAQRNIINTELDHLRELIETKRKQLLSKSALEEKQKRVTLQNQVERAEAVRNDSSSLVSRSQDLLVLPSEHAFLAVLLPLIQDMKKCASQPVDTSQQVSVIFRPLCTDAQVRSLGDMDLAHPRQTATLDTSHPGRLQSMTRGTPLAHTTGVSSMVTTQAGAVAAAALQVGLAANSDAAVAPNYSVLPPGYAGSHATLSYVGATQQAYQPQQQATALLGGQGAVSQSVYVYRSMHPG